MIGSALLLLCLQSYLKVVVGRVSSPEFVLEPPSRVYVSDSSGVTLRCAALGSPAPTITWVSSGGHTITPIPGVREISANGTLWVGSNLSPNQVVRGNYRCKASNFVGSVISRSTTVTIVIPEELSPRVEVSPVRVGGVATLRCRIDAPVFSEALVTSWTLQKSTNINPVPVPDAGRYIYGHSGTLFLLDVTKEDAFSKFRCRVAPKGQAKKLLVMGTTIRPEISYITSPPVSIKVLDDSDADTAPRIDSSIPLTVQVTDGSPFTMPCIAFAKPSPRYSWTRDGHSGNLPITTLSNAIGINMPSSSELWARGPILGSGRARSSHGGSYTCIVANSKGSDRANFEVTVLQELRVSILPQQQTVAAGGRAVIRCTVYGSPVAEVRWYKDGVPLLPHSHVLVQGREVIVGGASERDVGVYQCIAANSLGEAQAASYLGIRESIPEMTHKFIEQTLQPGPAVTLTCAALGHPIPSITWIRDGQPISMQSNHYSTSRLSVGSWVDSNGQVVGQVNISSVTLMDGGLYECEASNRVGRVAHRSRLNIYGSPTTRQSANLTAISKREAILPCPVVGYPLIDIQWLIDSRPMTPTLRRFPKADGTLYIREVDATQDSRRYSCTATNAEGVYATASFFLDVLNPPVLAEIKFPDNLFEGMRLSVLCTLLEGDVPISIRWSRDGEARLPEDPTVSQSHAHFYSNLVFTKVQGRHAGKYTCTASNTAASTSVSASMNVKVPPSWVVEPVDVRVVSGEDFTLECHASGTPMPTVTWRRPQADLSLAESPEVSSDGWRVTLPRQGTLRIRAARVEDGGRYICHVRNEVMPALSKVIEVAILEGATIDGRVGNETIGIGGRLELPCTARGHQPILFTWSLNGNPLLSPSLSTGVSVHEEKGGTVSVLVLESATRDQAAVYTCQAANAYGAATKTFFVSVVENPDPPAHVHVVRVTSRELSLAWAPPFDGNSPLTHYLVQLWVAEEGRRGPPMNTTAAADKTNTVIQGLSPGTQYHVQVLALNEIGASSPSPTLSITTQMEPPSMPPSGVTAVPSSKGVLTVTWQPPPGDARNHVTGYQIGHRMSKSSEDYIWRSVRSTTLTTELRGLEHFTTYEVSIRAINEVGSGPLSPPVKSTTSQAEPTSSPNNVDCAPLSSHSVRVRWNSILSNDSHGPIQGYKVFFKKVQNSKGSNRIEVKRTTNLETNLQDLQPFTNYSVRVLAYNGAGDGKLSDSAVCATLQDKPGAPSLIKAIRSGKTSVTVSWTEPASLNGVLTHYTLYYRPLNAQQELSREVDNLDAHSHYEFWVRSSNRVGEGPASRVVAQSPGDKVAARIKSFGQYVEGITGQPLTLPCNVIGFPPPSATWNPPGQTLDDNSLRFSSLFPHNEGNYTCTARNVHGRDEVTWVVRVVSPPLSPTAHVMFTTENAIHLSWTTRGDGGNPVTAYIVRFKESVSGREVGTQPDQDWQEREAEPNETRYVLQDMKCGTTFHIQILAVNSIGRGELSQTVTTRTRGSEPRPPRSNDLITVNSSAITLHLYTWPSGGCPILYFLVTHRGQSERFLSPTRLPGTVDTFTLRDLAALAWYEVKIVAFNSAGSNTVSYRIATPSSTGVTLAPDLVVEVQQVGIKVPPYLDPHVLAPIVSGIACTLALLLCVAIAISRGSCFSKKRKGEKDCGDISEGKALMFFKRGLRHRNESCESLSPAARAKHEEAYGVDDNTYEICPYATFSTPLGNPFPGPPSADAGEGETLDYSLQFQTFGLQECLEGQQPCSLSPGGAQSSSSSSSGWMFLKGRGGGTNGIKIKQKRRSGEIRCLSNEQTLPIGSVAMNRFPRDEQRKASKRDAEGGSDSEPEDISESVQQYARDNDSYRVPIKLKRGSDFSFHPPDSSTESNDERSPQAPRRPPHTQHHLYKPEAGKPQRPHHQQPRRQQSQQFPPITTNHPRRSNTIDSVYSVDGALSTISSKDGSVNSPIMPPSGFLDCREFSEAECDREQKSNDTAGIKPSAVRSSRIRHPLTTQAGANDYTIHV